MSNGFINREHGVETELVEGEEGEIRDVLGTMITLILKSGDIIQCNLPHFYIGNTGTYNIL